MESCVGAVVVCTSLWLFGVWSSRGGLALSIKGRGPVATKEVLPALWGSAVDEVKIMLMGMRIEAGEKR